ncbi:MAG TPA: LuxR C-terminal-related transcriptional regulator [Nocardioidaceae bacterium]|nr:LuxR C-terminal-related transcriptional regulator [Nocardioidaceae bacterium]
MIDGSEVGTGKIEGPDHWRRLYDELTAGDVSRLDPEELESLAQAAFWLGSPREAITARSLAYGIHRDAGDHAGAARMCWRLFHSHFELDETAAASGWLSRARRHIGEVPDSIEAGYVAIAAAMWAGFCGDLDEAVEQADAAHELGQARRDRNLAAWGLAMSGGMRVARGDVTEGVAVLDEAMIETISGDLSPFVTGWIYCFLLKTCQALGDIRRASEWTQTAVQWCERQGVDSWYPGVCRLHRCEVASLRGDWASAEREALRVAEELAPFGDYLVAEGQYIAGEIRRLRGEYDLAEAAFRRAHELGHDPQPGRALLRLARGDAQGAANQLRLALIGGTRQPLSRARLLDAHVSAALALDDTESAARSVEELAELARSSQSRLLWGLLAKSHGSLLLVRDDLDAAVPLLREAASIFQQLECPYELAQTRLALGSAARQAGDEQTAALEFEAASAAFARLGATPDAEQASALSRGGAQQNPLELSDREVEVLRLVARGLSNRDIAAHLVISEHTVRRHLSNLFRKIGVTSRSAATAFAFEHDIAG